MSNCENSTALDLLVSKRHLTLQFNNLCYKPPSLSKTDKPILNNVTGQFKSGRLSAILGPSGAGKTSLLNVLSAFKYTGVQGTVTLNGESRDPVAFRKISSYISQNFAMLDYLTARETIQIAADLKLASSISRKVKEETVENIVKLLNLQKCQNNYVERLSGGERKRLSIAVELITNPPIMFFDEPTSGLDSVSSLQVMTYLKKLASNGLAIICVIHQPSSRLLELFDDVLVLSEGECLYNGPLDNMLDCFETAGFTCPTYYNRADFAIEIASRNLPGDLSTLILLNKKKFSTLDSVVVGDDIGKGMNTNGISGFVNYFKHRRRKYPVSYAAQFWILFKRSLISMSRDLLTVQMKFVCHVVVALLLGIVFWNIGTDAAKILSNSSCLFFFILLLFYANTMATIISFPLEAAVFLREHLNGWYSIEAYYFSKLVSDLPLLFSCPTLFCAIAYYLTGQPIELDRFLMFWGICLLVAFHGHSLGLVSGALFSIKLAVFLVPISIIPMLVFSGFFVRTYEFPEYLRPFTDISYMRYMLEGLNQAVYGYNRTRLECSIPFCYFGTPQKFLQVLDMDGDRYWIDVLAIILWILFFYISLYITLLIKVKRRQ